MPGVVNAGVIGLGRLGAVYARYVAHRVTGARLVAVADGKAERLREIADELGGVRAYGDHRELLEDQDIDAVLVVTPTSTHKQVVMDAAARRKAIFCEKPIALALEDGQEMVEALERAGVFFHVGFQRRFDPGYLAAKRKIEEGVIGQPIVMSAVSRDPYPPALEFCDPRKSGGLIADMGIHDFDLGRMFLGEVESVHAIGGALAYPEMRTVGDIDNAIVNLRFESGALGTVQLSRNAVFGYDIRTEIWGTKGSLQIGYAMHTPLVVMTQAGITHGVVPGFMQRFEAAYLAQIQDFVDRVAQGKRPSLSGADAMAALRISLAATRSRGEGRPVRVSEVEPARPTAAG
jgi:scyllo-inositol 2-dehydrogenase (NAD+)